MHYIERGDGAPILVLHGSGVDHRELVDALEPALRESGEFRRLYPDLPGTGRTAAPDTIRSSDHVVEVVLALVDSLIGHREFLVVGHSSGGYLARAIADRRRDQVAGLAVICPLIEAPRAVPAHSVVHDAGDAIEFGNPTDRAAFEDYFVVHTPEMGRRFRDRVAPGIALVDQDAMERIGQRWQLNPPPEDGPAFVKPTLIIAGRQDSHVGYAGQWDLLEHYPRATFAVLDRAGHALPHEQPALIRALLAEWLRRVQEQLGN